MTTQVTAFQDLPIQLGGEYLFALADEASPKGRATLVTFTVGTDQEHGFGALGVSEVGYAL